jgi:uncharacterized protein YbaR (Trm112 family)
VTIPGSIRDLLACPRCHGPLKDALDGRALDCPACALRFAVRDGIPVMLLDQAEPLPPTVS